MPRTAGQLQGDRAARPRDAIDTLAGGRLRLCIALGGQGAQGCCQCAFVVVLGAKAVQGKVGGIACTDCSALPANALGVVQAAPAPGVTARHTNDRVLEHT